MITLRDKKECCGCSACSQVCPHHCITMIQDQEGFLYPSIDETKCTQCGLCKKVCPIINQYDSSQPIKVLGAINKDKNIQVNSSSGGAFTVFAKHVINNNGVVFGAVFNDEWEVQHDAIENISHLSALRGSKYVQSIMGDSYKRVKAYLDKGREVLFSGTPCQVAGLKHFLRRDYNNLFTIEVVCHGVPSPTVWRDYLSTLRLQLSNNDSEYGIYIHNIRFRDKYKGWQRYYFRVDYRITNGDFSFLERFDRNIFMRGFLKNIYLRPSCYDCPAKQFKSRADISLADFWGIELVHKDFYDKDGVGLIFINTQKGVATFDTIRSEIDCIITDYQKAITHNPCIAKSVAKPKYRERFWDLYRQKGILAIDQICKETRPSIFRRVIKRIKRVL